MTNKFSFVELSKLMAPEEAISIKKRIHELNEKYSTFIQRNNSMFYQYEKIMKFFFDDKKYNIEIPIPEIKETYKNSNGGISSPNLPPLTLNIKDNVIGMNDKSSKWGGIRVDEFSPTKTPEHMRRDIATLLFSDDTVYNQLYIAFNDYGKEVISKLREVYKGMNLDPIVGKIQRYKIDNITPEEKQIFNIRSETASLYIKFEHGMIFFCIGNNGPPYGEPYPKFNRRAFDRVEDGTENVLEKAFMVNHYDDIMRGLELFETHKMPMLRPHEEFMTFANNVAEKFIMLNKI